ncbi:MAG: energy-coupling factor ABC transporter permease [Syntrophobacteraceae bacterium]|nr:energy-coupling factor ABC transporter permease [Syntrophobacteraceae bacterium]
MHMADALISPEVGGVMWGASAALTLYSARKVKKSVDEGAAPLMGVLGAFIFAAQMINFSIPATGSSGHLGGGMILAVLLGPYAAFLTMASILTVQALFFADGGILALGCNMFNLGFFPCFVAYPFIYRKIAGNRPTRGRILAGATLGSIIGLQLGALFVVIETTLSGISELPVGAFLLLMQPIHLAIGLVEGLVTAAVLNFVRKARPELLTTLPTPPSKSLPVLSLKPLLLGFIIVSVIVAGTLSWFASSNPDGLEWSIHRTTGKEELEPPKDTLHRTLAAFQETLAFLPDYDFKKREPSEAGLEAPREAEEDPWPAVKAGTSVAGLVGGTMTLAAVSVIALCLRKLRSRTSPGP